MNCKYCGRLLPPPLPGARRQREFCNHACKQSHYRKTHQMQADISGNLAAAHQRIAELEQENMRLLSRLDVERRYHQDIKPYGFKSWLKKQPLSPLMKRLLDDELIPVRGSRSIYEAYLRKQAYSADDMQEFAHLWKALLLQS